MDLSAATEQSDERPAPQWPSVADYWPDAAKDQPGPAPMPAPPPAPAPAVQPAPMPAPMSAPPPAAADDGITWIGAPRRAPGKSRRMRVVLGAAVALALLVITGGVLVTLVRQAHDDDSVSAGTLPEPPAAVPLPTDEAPLPTGAATVAPAPAPTSAAPSAKAGGTRAAPPPPKLPATATFELGSSTPAVTLHTRDLGTDLYRVKVVKDKAVVARVSAVGTVQRLTLSKGGKPAAAAVDITLNSGVRWSLRAAAGNAESVMNFADSRLAAVEVAGGSRDLELTLPKAAGTLPVRVTRGAGELKINTAGDPVRLSLREGVGTVVLDGDTDKGNAPGKVFTSKGFDDARNRVSFEATAGFGTLTVDTD